MTPLPEDIHDLKEIKERIAIVKKAMIDKMGDVHHTVKILLWDDGTSLVECKYGSADTLHNYTHYEGILSYKEDPLDFEKIYYEDEFGNLKPQDLKTTAELIERMEKEMEGFTEYIGERWHGFDDGHWWKQIGQHEVNYATTAELKQLYDNSRKG